LSGEAAESSEISVARLSSGIYLIRVETNGKRFTGKIIKR
ncbi:MAG: T9SS type A sorting domain-containing protein, partial [Bacteroidales bacterium]|nr:T9SS type A sorting domain-containing protein [Bacteroidales bacterium]